MKRQEGIQHLASNREGAYEFKGLPAGKYQIGVSLPNYVSLPPQESEITLPGRGCYSFDLPLESNGQIEGRISDDKGNPVPHQSVELATAERTNPADFRAESDEAGRYHFTGVFPGDFVIGINLSDPPEEKSPFVRTYYPNALRRENATVVHLSKAEHLRGHDIYVSQRTAPRTVEGIVLWPEGKPATNATISLEFADYPWRTDPQKSPDAQGRFSLKVLTNVRTMLWVQGKDANGLWMNAGQIELPTEGTVKAQTLYLDHEPLKWTPPE